MRPPGSLHHRVISSGVDNVGIRQIYQPLLVSLVEPRGRERARSATALNKSATTAAIADSPEFCHVIRQHRRFRGRNPAGIHRLLGNRLVTLVRHGHRGRNRLATHFSDPFHSPSLPLASSRNFSRAYERDWGVVTLTPNGNNCYSTISSVRTLNFEYFVLTPLDHRCPAISKVETRINPARPGSFSTRERFTREYLSCEFLFFLGNLLSS